MPEVHYLNAQFISIFKTTVPHRNIIWGFHCTKSLANLPVVWKV